MFAKFSSFAKFLAHISRNFSLETALNIFLMFNDTNAREGILCSFDGDVMNLSTPSRTLFVMIHVPPLTPTTKL